MSAEVVNALREAAGERASQTTIGPEVTASATPSDAASGAPVEIRIVVEFRGLASEAAAKTAAAAADSETQAHPATDGPQSPEYMFNHRPMSPFDPLSGDKSLPKMMPVSLPITLSNARGHIQDVVHTATQEIHKTMAEICDQKIDEFKQWLFIQDRRIFRE